MSGQLVFRSSIDGTFPSELDYLEGELDGPIDGQSASPTFLGLNYIWWIAITVVIVIILVGFLIWWFTRTNGHSNQTTSNTTNNTGTNSNTSSTIAGNPTSTNSTSINGTTNPPINNGGSSTSGTSTNPTGSSSTGSSSTTGGSNNGSTGGGSGGSVDSGPSAPPIPPNPVNPANPPVDARTILGYPDLANRQPNFDPFIQYKNVWLSKENQAEAKYPLCFHLARLFTITDGKKYYLQFNDPYLPDTWPDPKADLFTWTTTPDQADIYSSTLRTKSDGTKEYRLYVYQRPSPINKDLGNRIIYVGRVDGYTYSLSTTKSEGTVYLTLKNGLIYLTADCFIFANDGTAGHTEAWDYYIDKGVGRFCSAKRAEELKLKSFLNYPIGVEAAPVDINRFAEHIGKSG